MNKQLIQEIFDKVAAHLLKQNKKSLRPSGDETEGHEFECAYRGQDGLKCAIGCLIPDDKYEARFEGLRVSIIMEELGFNKHDTVLKQFLNELQFTHDCNDISVWKDKLLKLAKTYDLKRSAIHKATQ